MPCLPCMAAMLLGLDDLGAAAPSIQQVEAAWNSTNATWQSVRNNVTTAQWNAYYAVWQRWTAQLTSAYNTASGDQLNQILSNAYTVAVDWQTKAQQYVSQGNEANAAKIAASVEAQIAYAKEVGDIAPDGTIVNKNIIPSIQGAQQAYQAQTGRSLSVDLLHGTAVDDGAPTNSWAMLGILAAVGVSAYFILRRK